jgi:hypothetical protein
MSRPEGPCRATHASHPVEEQIAKKVRWAGASLANVAERVRQRQRRTACRRASQPGRSGSSSDAPARPLAASAMSFRTRLSSSLTVLLCVRWASVRRRPFGEVSRQRSLLRIGAHVRAPIHRSRVFALVARTGINRLVVFVSTWPDSRHCHGAHRTQKCAACPGLSDRPGWRLCKHSPKVCL